MSALLIDGRFVAVFPRLVRALGGDISAAAVLQAIHYRMQALDWRADPWMPMFIAEIADEIGISGDQAQRATKRLRDHGLLAVRGDRGQIREWSIDYEAVMLLEQGYAQSRHPVVTRDRVGGDAESRQGNAESRRGLRDIALHSSLLEEEEVKEEKRTIVRKPVLIGEDVNFNGFWDIYPRKEGKAKARIAWAKALRKVDAGTILAGASRYRDDPNREAAFTAHAATWLNGERWDDEMLPARDSKGERKVSEVAEMIRRAAERDAVREIEA